MRVKPLVFVLFVINFIVFLGCNEYERVSKQFPTFVDMLNMSIYIQYIIDDGKPVSDSDFAGIVNNYGGLDRWGNPYLYRVRRSHGISFIFVSLGADGKLDVGDIEVYFEMEQVDIVGLLDRDIVTRNGTWATNASDK